MASHETYGEIRSKAVAAAEAVYRLSQLEGFDPALKFELRRYATRILGRLAGLTMAPRKSKGDGVSDILADVAGIKELIGFAAEKGFIAANNSELVAEAYNFVGHSLDDLRDRTNKGSEEEERPSAVRRYQAPTDIIGGDLNERQRKILEYVAGRDQAHIIGITGLFGQTYSKKTLQRDLWQLIDSGLIRRQGGNRWTTYSLSTLSKRVSRLMNTNVSYMS